MLLQPLTPVGRTSINTAIGSGKSDDDAALAWLMRVLFIVVQGLFIFSLHADEVSPSDWNGGCRVPALPFVVIRQFVV